MARSSHLVQAGHVMPMDRLNLRQNKTNSNPFVNRLLRGMWEFPPIRGPVIDPEIVGSSSKDPHQKNPGNLCKQLCGTG